MSTLDSIARAQGAISAMQSTVGALIASACEAEERAVEAERRVRDLERQLSGVTELRREQLRAEYRRGYGTGYAAAREGREPQLERALTDVRVVRRQEAVAA